MEKFARGVEKISKFFMYGATIMLLGMMMLGTTDVVGRYLFNRPIIGALEISRYCCRHWYFSAWLIRSFVGEHITAGVIDFFRFKPETRTKIQFGVQVLVLSFLANNVARSGRLNDCAAVSSEHQ